MRVPLQALGLVGRLRTGHIGSFFPLRTVTGWLKPLGVSVTTSYKLEMGCTLKGFSSARVTERLDIKIIPSLSMNGKRLVEDSMFSKIVLE